MKKQISVFALAAASVAIGMSSAYAAAPLPGNSFNPNSYNTTGINASTITVGGTIPEFIQFTAVDNNIELGNIGGPEATGVVDSVDGRRSAGNTTVGFTKGTDTAAGQGDAVIEFKANTFIRIKFSGDQLVNLGPDGVVGTDDITLPTSYRVAIKGKVQFATGETRDGGVFSGPGTNGQNPTNPGAYASYNDPSITAANPNDINLTFSPGGPVNDGFGNANTDPNLPSGFRVMAEATRNGLNDYRGAYNTQINLTYFKY